MGTPPMLKSFKELMLDTSLTLPLSIKESPILEQSPMLTPLFSHLAALSWPLPMATTPWDPEVLESKAVVPDPVESDVTFKRVPGLSTTLPLPSSISSMVEQSPILTPSFMQSTALSWPLPLAVGPSDVMVGDPDVRYGSSETFAKFPLSISVLPILEQSSMLMPVLTHLTALSCPSPLLVGPSEVVLLARLSCLVMGDAVMVGVKVKRRARILIMADHML